MAYIEQSRRPTVSRVVLEHLDVHPGPVNNLFIVKTMFCHTRDDIFTALHVLNALVSTRFDFAVNQSREAQIVVRCHTAQDCQTLERASSLTFKFDDKYVKIVKLCSVSFLPEHKDLLYNSNCMRFAASTQPDLVPSYPRVFFDLSEDMQRHTNPKMSVTTMQLLRIGPGETQGLVKVNMKYLLNPECMHLANHVVPFKGEFRVAVDQDGSLFMKFDKPQDALHVSRIHYYTGSFMIKFYLVNSLAIENRHFDKAKLSPIYFRVRREDEWEVLHS